MPVITRVAINEDEVLFLKIARINSNLGKEPNQINVYAVCLEDKPDWEIDYEKLPVRVNHRYGDGAAILVVKAIEAVRNYQSDYGELDY